MKKDDHLIAKKKAACPYKCQRPGYEEKGRETLYFDRLDLFPTKGDPFKLYVENEKHVQYQWYCDHSLEVEGYYGQPYGRNLNK